MTFALGHANIQQTDRMGDELKTVNAVRRQANVVAWNEARDAKGPLAALLGWDSVVAGGLGISWETSVLTLVGSGHRTVMLGGHVGADGKPGGDDRRVGPSRLVLWAVLRERSSGRRVLVATHHSVARADTSAKWRRGIRAKGWAGVVAELRTVAAVHAPTKTILTGDMNTIGAITAFVGLGIREARTPPTYGRLRYDRIFGAVTDVRTIRTMSDHLALLATVTLDGAADPAAPPAPVAPAKVPASPRLTRWQRRRLNRLERRLRRGKRLRPFQKRALLRLRRLRGHR